MNAERAFSVSEALSLVLDTAPFLGREDVPLDQTLRRYLADDAALDADLPPFDRAAMDGYALRAADVAGAPATLRLVGEVRAGQTGTVTVGPGEAISIMTGAPVPSGADAVQQIEKTRRSGDLPSVEILSPVAADANVAPRGSEGRAGDVVLRRGGLIDPPAVAVLAAVGRRVVSVGRRPTVAILVTGDEVVPVDAEPPAGKIRNSNGPALRAHALEAGAEVKMLGIAPDDEAALSQAMAPGFDADVLVVSGGVSAGAYDLVEGVFDRFGVEVFFRRVAIKPGAPLVFGRRGRTLVFGLPGNPVSSQVTFEVFVRPALLKMQGAGATARPRLDVELSEPATNRSGRAAHIPARVSLEGPRPRARLLKSLGSADIVAHAAANALVVLDAERTSAAAGESAPAVLLGSFLDKSDGA